MDAAVVPRVLFATLQIKDVRQCKAVGKNNGRKRRGEKKSEKRWKQRSGGGLKIDSGDERAKRNEGEEI